MRDLFNRAYSGYAVKEAGPLSILGKALTNKKMLEYGGRLLNYKDLGKMTFGQKRQFLKALKPELQNFRGTLNGWRREASKAGNPGLAKLYTDQLKHTQRAIQYHSPGQDKLALMRGLRAADRPPLIPSNRGLLHSGQTLTNVAAGARNGLLRAGQGLSQIPSKLNDGLLRVGTGIGNRLIDAGGMVNRGAQSLHRGLQAAPGATREALNRLKDTKVGLGTLGLVGGGSLLAGLATPGAITYGDRIRRRATYNFLNDAGNVKTSYPMGLYNEAIKDFKSRLRHAKALTGR